MSTDAITKASGAYVYAVRSPYKSGSGFQVMPRRRVRWVMLALYALALSPWFALAWVALVSWGQS